MRKYFIIGTILLLLLVAVSSVSSQQGSNGDRATYPIRLKSGTFVPPANSPALPSVAEQNGTMNDAPSFYIVQFDGPVTDARKASITDLGGSIRGYIPDFAFKVRMTAAEATAVNNLTHVTWVGQFQPAYRISPNLTLDGQQLYRIQMEPDLSQGRIRRLIQIIGARVVSQADQTLVILAVPSQVQMISTISEVAWIENYLLYEKHNEYGAGVIVGANIANNTGYDGSTQTVAVADTGFGTGNASNAHPDVPASRITAIQDFPSGNGANCYNSINDGAIDPDSGHGTHTALSVVGDGDGTGVGQGTAPAANLVFQSIEDYVDFIGSCSFQYQDGYYLLGIPDNLNNLYQPAYNAGARIHSNSWGSSVAGEYTQNSADTDQFSHNNQDMLITFSAGNSGIDANSNGVVDNDSIGAPATAKNVLTVGASENDRQGNWDCDTSLGYTSCASQGGQNDLFTYGTAWPDDFPAAPLFNDPSAGNANQMAAFSSRGPTDDGRIKPDVVAPGTWILSGYSELYQQGYDPSANPQNGAWQYDGWGHPYSDDYKYSGGTSMSNPITAGGAAVIRDFYNKNHGHDASAALVKATLINTADDLLDENNDGANDNDFPIPNVHEGWGIIDLAEATDGSQEWVDEATGLSTSGSQSYNYSVSSSGDPLRITLVWTDYPSTAAASANLVNNLNLTVTGPGGSPVYRGNNFSNGWSTTSSATDSVNNVENVYVQSAAAGIWTVTVSGSNVPQGPQSYALVVNGTFGAVTPTNTPPPPPTNTPGPSPTPTNTAVAPVCVTYSSSDTPINMPNGVSSIASNISVGGTSGTISDVNVSVDNPHAWVGDLIFTVGSPSGTNVTIIDQPGVPASSFGCSGDDILATLDDDAAAPVENQCAGSVPTINGTFSPNNPLSNFNGLNADGTWTLTIQDTYTSADAGSLDSWSIEICTTGGGGSPTNTPVPPTNTPVPPTNTPVLPTSTSAPPTNTPVPPTSTSVPPTNTPAPPTNTPVPPTNTPIPPTSTPGSGGDDVIYVSSSSGGNVGGVSFADEDILAFDTGTNSWSMYIDGSDVGLSGSGSRDVDAFHVSSDGSVLMSFVGATTIPNVGSVDDSDIVRFVPTSTGTSTSGSFEWYFDGSDVGLSSNGEDVDGVYLTASGDLLISTLGGYSVPGASGSDEDLIRFSPTSLGSSTSGSWSIEFDGSDVGLNNSGSEDTSGVWVDESNGDIYLTVRGTFSVAGLSGDGSDVFACAPSSLGGSTSCSGFTLIFDGSANGYGAELMDGLSVLRP